jgi:DNA-binding NarL/FixJ family response regulator
MNSAEGTPTDKEPGDDAGGRLRVVVADDDALIREGIAALLRDAGHVVVGRAHDAPDLLLKVRSYVPDVAIVDVRMPPGMLELVGEDSSGVGYLLKDRVRDVAEFLDAVERVAAGGTAFDPAVVNSLVGGRRRSRLDELTDREREVLSLIAEGRSNRAIAARLFLSPRAIERHVQAIFQKLQLPGSEDDNRRVLAVLALLGH